MALVKHDKTKQEVAPRHLDLFDRFFDDWPEMFRRPVVLWPERGIDSMGIEEFVEDGTLVVRVELAGVDPDKDIEVSVEDDVLHIGAQRRQEEKTEEREYVRQELRYGSFHRDLPLPRGTTDADIKACYKNGILEVRVPTSAPEATSVKVPIKKG
jgi:HSP20 family protein